MMRSYLAELFRAYAAILFVDRAWIGASFAAATFLFPNVGLSGLLGATTGLATVHVMRFPDHQSGLHVFNSLLVGLSLGAFFQFDLYVAALVVVAAAFTVFVTVTLADGLWRWDRLPVLSVPFVLVAVLAAMLAHSYSGLRRYDALLVAPATWFGNWIDSFLCTLGAVYFTPHPLAGAILFAGLLWRSRYLAALALGGYLAGLLVFSYFTHAPQQSLLVWSGFNFALSALAVGGIYTIPSLMGFFFALCAAIISAMLSAAFMSIALTYHLPIMAAPFLITTLTLLAALRKRVTLAAPWLAPEPGLPEANYERARLATVRAGELNSVPLLLPVFGEWRVYQGFGGPHTHQPPWRHALDFHMTENNRSYRGDGKRLEDFLCFDLPVVSPAHGEVVRVQDDLPDNPPGEVDVRNNWGNFVLLRLHGELYVLLAHLRRHSIKVKEGQRVVPGTPLAQCGNSGRSPQPHVHLQVQRDAAPGSPTHPFHLCSVVLRRKNQTPEYHVVARPDEGDLVRAAEADVFLASRLHLPVGRRLEYRFNAPGVAERHGVLSIELTLTGQFRLVSERGASAAFAETNGVLAFYDRRGARDPLLDLVVLALGLTPLTERARTWSDAPSATLLPLTPLQRVILGVLRPLGCGVDSRYQRVWNARTNQWLQSARHELRVALWRWVWQTEVIIDVEDGCRELTLRSGDQEWRATLTGAELRGDEGIPGWSYDVAPDPVKHAERSNDESAA